MPFIHNSADLRRVIRNGPYAWPGGYPLFFITSDGATLAFSTVEKEYKSVLNSIKYRHNDGWCVVAYDINYESLLYDDHTGEQIKAAYDVIEDY